MRIAVDRNDNRVSVYEAVSRGDYFCEACGKPLIFRNGEIRAKHFAHKPNLTCSDNWNHGNESESYDISEWHNEWQAFYPKDNIEIIIPFQIIRHRADVLIGKTVIEFQHSSISSLHFQERTNYYLNLGYKVIWLFDFTAEYAEGKIIKRNYSYEWTRPKSTFRDVTNNKDNVDLFFQLKDDGECIARVTEINPNGFEVFGGSQLLSKNEFLSFTGLHGGICNPPSVEKVKEINDDLQAFTRKYNVKLDKEQLRAVQSIEGANLVLSVPGSGKTTVLAYRLGYMTLVKGIKPEDILAITFTKNAAAEMQNRLKQYFHNDIKGYIDIRTINSLALDIVKQKNGGINNTANDEIIRQVIVSLFKKHRIHFFADTIKLYNSAICFVKSRLDQNVAMNEALMDTRLEKFRVIFNDYNSILREKGVIDFNDQNILALKYLKEDEDLLKQYQDKYRYVCVDEAQDTNQIQYEMIRLLSCRENNIFMVGDEDQSIYGFNGSYPEALLNFRDEYANPFILRLERNYRSTNQIVDKARAFIDKNTRRNKKEIYSFRGDGKEVVKLEVSDIGTQAKELISAIKESDKDVAILYRENGSAIPVINELLNNDMSYTLLKNEIDFFNSSNYRKVESILRLAINPNDFNALLDARQVIMHNLYPKSIYGANKLRIENGYDNLFDALSEYLKQHPFTNSFIAEERTTKVKKQIHNLLEMHISDAVKEACAMAINDETQCSKVEGFLLPLTERVSNINGFLSRVDEIKQSIWSYSISDEKEKVKLGTIHSAKGLEFDTVYLIDVFDGVFPSFPSSYNQKQYEEERRIFYVAITRAKDELYIFKNTKETCSFVDELFPDLSTYYEIVYRDKETGKELLPPKLVNAHVGDIVTEEAPKIEGYICKNNRIQKEISQVVSLLPIEFTYYRKKIRVNFIVPEGVIIPAGKEMSSMDISEKQVIAPVVYISGDCLFEWYIDEEKTILAEKNGEYLLLPKTDISENEYTEINFYGLKRDIVCKSLLDIGDEVDFNKVLIVENTSGQQERITQNIYGMFRKYHCIYGDKGPIEDFDKPIWKVVSKL